MKFVNASSESNVCFLQNCTAAANAVLYSELNSGDHVIISSLEHNAVFRPVYNICKEIKADYDVAKVDILDDKKTVDNFKKLIKKNTKLIFVTGASNVIGKKIPIKEIGELCKENNILFAVDGAQLVGISDVDVKSMNIDYLCIAPHKGLFAPMGVGVLVAERNLSRPLIYGGTGSNSAEAVQPEELPERIESGTINVPAIAGVKAGIDYVNNYGIENIEKYEMTLAQYLYKKLLNLGAILYTTFPYRRSFVPVISFNIKGLNSEETARHLNKYKIAARAGLHCAPLAHKQLGTLETGTVRLSPSIFNNAEEIDKTIFAIKRLI
jgi:selenocysteine lyase/cysteine desulfurase